MSERSQVTQLVQIGVEVTPGTLVAATKRLLGMDFETEVMTETDKFRPSGFKVDTVDAITKEWLQAKIKGQPSFGDLIYAFAGVLNTPTPNPPTQMQDGTTNTGAYKWIFEPTPSATDTPITFTLEQGSNVRAHRFGYSLFKQFGLKHTRANVDISGELIARLLADNFTLTPSLPAVELIPQTANIFDVYLDSTNGALGTTKLSRLFEGQFEFNNRWGPIWIVDSSQTSFAGHVELPVASTYKALVEADAQGMGLLATLRAGSTQFLRVRALGPTIYSSRVVNDGVTNGTTTFTSATAAFTAADVGKAISGGTIPANTTIVTFTNGTTVVMSATATTASAQTITIGTSINYSMTIDMAVKIEKPAAFKDEQGIYAVEFTMQNIYDPTWNKFLHVEVINKTTAL